MGHSGNPRGRSPGAASRRPLPEVLGDSELEALLAAPSSESVTGLRNRTVLSVLGKAGLRVSECCGLRVSDVRLKGPEPYLNVHGKGGKQRRAWIGNGLRDLLALWMERKPKGRVLFPVIARGDRTFGTAVPGRAVSRQSVYGMVRHYSTKTLGRPIHPHVLRHTMASAWLRAGKSLQAVQRQLGHAFAGTTLIYLDTVGGECSKAAQDMDGAVENIDTELLDLAKKLKGLPAETRSALAGLLQ